MTKAFGPALYALWTQRVLILNESTFNFILISVAMNLLWNSSTLVPVAINQHVSTALWLTGCTFGALSLMVILAGPLGLAGAALALVVADSVMVTATVSKSLQFVDDNWRNFLRGIIPISRLARQN